MEEVGVIILLQRRNVKRKDNMRKTKMEIADFIKSKWNLTDDQLEGDILTAYMDSLDMIELAMELEKMYKITISDDELFGWRFFSDVVRCVREKVLANK